MSSSPANGAVLEAAPSEVRITFTEAPDLGLSEIDAFDSTGDRVDTGELRATSGDPRTVSVPLPELPRDTYTVSWRVLSTVDGHVTTGSFAFGVGEAVQAVADPAGSTTDEQRPTLLSVASRWGFYWGLALLLGAALGILLRFRRSPTGAWLPWLAWALAGAGVAGMFVAERTAAEVSAADLLGSERGKLLVARGAAVLLALPTTIWAARAPARRSATALLAVVAAAMAVHAYSGHAGAVERLPLLHVGVQWMHLLSVGAWAGGLVWMLLGSGGGSEEDRAAGVRRFSAMATVALPVVAVTGVLRALNEVGLDAGRLFETGFGLSALGKSALFVGMAALGAYNRYRVVPRLDAPRLGLLRRIVAGEVLLAAGAFGLSGVMAGLPPPALAPRDAAPVRVVAQGSDFAGLLHVRLIVTPGTPGINRFEARVTDGDGALREDVTGVRLGFRLPARPEIGTSELELDRAAAGVWLADGPNLSVDGTWEVGALVVFGGDSRTIDLTVRTRLPEQDITVSEIEGRPTVSTIALPEGHSVQGYVEPATAGPNEVHVTVFAPDGAEQPVELERFEAVPEDGEAIELEPIELSPGHFVAQTELEVGRWTFHVEAATPDGTSLRAYFPEMIEA